MIILLSAVAMAAAAPVAAQQPTTPEHAGHNAPQTEQRGKGCSCCKDKTGDTQANEKKMKCRENKQRDAATTEHSQHNH